MFFSTLSAILTLQIHEIASSCNRFMEGCQLIAAPNIMSNIFCLISHCSKLTFKTVVLNNWKKAGIFFIHVYCSFCNIYSEYHDESSFFDNC